MNGEDRQFLEKLLEVHVSYLIQKIDSVNFNIGKKTDALEKKFDENFPDLSKKVENHDRYIKRIKRRWKVIISSFITFLIAMTVYFSKEIISFFL